MNICVFCSSSDVIEPEYFSAATELGQTMAARRDVLIYGGANVGLMGTLARVMHQCGGRVVGIIPGFMASRGLAYAPADELVLTRDLRERKAFMEDRADAFLALPGGFGTLEEMSEVITLKQFGLVKAPLVAVNTRGFYDSLAAFFERFYEDSFAKPAFRATCPFVPTPADAMAYIRGYEPPALTSKWFH